MHRKFFFYKYKYSKRSRSYRVYKCRCRECSEFLRHFSYKDSYDVLFDFDSEITEVTVANLGFELVQHATVSPVLFLERSSEYLMGYTEFMVNISQIYLIMMKHVTFRLSHT